MTPSAIVKRNMLARLAVALALALALALASNRLRSFEDAQELGRAVLDELRALPVGKVPPRP